MTRCLSIINNPGQYGGDSEGQAEVEISEKAATSWPLDLTLDIVCPG